MRPLLDLYYIRADASLETRHTMTGGQEIYIEKDFNPYERAVQFGEIVHCPMRISNNLLYEVDLRPGDKIYFHHFVVQEDNFDEINGEKLYRCMYNNIFCVVRDGEIIPVQDWVFLTPVLEPEENYKTKSGIILKTERKTLRNIGEVQFMCKRAEQWGLKKGDQVYWMNDSDYKIKVEGKEYWRMSLRRILATVN